ncbi:MAG: DUF202 domain-containing protein [Gammaproteobacteria bacterium]|nr:DUF202 domain-containing protein [Gammaproteobacteria bacterium]
MSSQSTGTSTATELARERNREAAERTLLAWIRTTISMIGFGIGFGAAGNYLAKSGPEPTRIHDLEWVGSAFILLGVVALFAAVIQNVRLLKRIRGADFVYLESFPMGLITAILMLVFGLLGFLYIHAR